MSWHLSTVDFLQPGSWLLKQTVISITNVISAASGFDADWDNAIISWHSSSLVPSIIISGRKFIFKIVEIFAHCTNVPSSKFT